MRDDTLVYTQITAGLVRLLKKVRQELQEEENKKPRNRIRITKKEVCQEFYKRCLIKKVV